MNGSLRKMLSRHLGVGVVLALLLSFGVLDVRGG